MKIDLYNSNMSDLISSTPFFIENSSSTNVLIKKVKNDSYNFCINYDGNLICNNEEYYADLDFKVIVESTDLKDNLLEIGENDVDVTVKIIFDELPE